ncbi:MAG: beta-galactosidase, partial [Duncaniella sp.]|nr:beta-galactosidase [Duncaniella sp.]
MKPILSSLLLAIAAFNPAWTAEAKTAAVAAEPATFEAGKGAFMLNGEPFVVKAAELHYPRIPRPYWDQRIKLSKGLRMPTVCLYVFW